ncbi:MAG TPA: SIS domain-containing protein [Spirochaetales bacterium]|nr:SIS domain-containing protein [Spirochaetales bacterium]HRY54492.1 SIS domain-containing protein [Spirochaetia bacterium]HRZ65081.1 SIS domain-containing protein [Spirochaetia bacterium]
MGYDQQIRGYFETLKATIDKIDRAEIERAMEALKRARDERRFIYAMGNGGSAATASHYAGDFNKGLSLGREKRFRVIALNDNAPTMLSLANDVDYASVFVEQLRNFLEPGDLVLAISGSGNSENVLRAARYARERGATVIGLTGFDGGKLRALSDVSLHVPIDNMQVVEDLHMVFDHLMMSILYRE